MCIRDRSRSGPCSAPGAGTTRPIHHAVVVAPQPACGACLRQHTAHHVPYPAQVEIVGEDESRAEGGTTWQVPSPAVSFSCTQRRARCARTSSGPPAACSVHASRWTGPHSPPRAVSTGPSTHGRASPVPARGSSPVSYTHLRAHETVLDLVCRLLLEKKKKKNPK